MERKNNLLIASDHRGFKLKNFLLQKYSMIDLGTYSEEAVDYNDYAKLLVAKLQKQNKGILICGTGIGMSIAANRYPKVRAALCYTEEMVKAAREHNDANILVLQGDLDEKKAEKFLTLFLATPFSEEVRHKRRVEKLSSC